MSALHHMLDLLLDLLEPVGLSPDSACGFEGSTHMGIQGWPLVVPDVQPHDVLPAQGQMLNLLKLFLIVVYLCCIFNDVDWTLSLFSPPTPLLVVLSSMSSFVI